MLFQLKSPVTHRVLEKEEHSFIAILMALRDRLQGSYAGVFNFIMILCSNEPNFYAFFMIFSLILGLFYAQGKIQ